jgi:hypothetical protein
MMPKRKGALMRATDFLRFDLVLNLNLFGFNSHAFPQKVDEQMATLVMMLLLYNPFAHSFTGICKQGGNESGYGATTFIWRNRVARSA